MPEGVRFAVGVAVAAARAGVGRIAVCRTGRFRHGGAVVVAERVDRSGLRFAAKGTDSGFLACRHTGRRGRLRPRAEVMAKRVRLTVGVAVAAAGAGIGRVAVCGAGRVCYGGAVVMPEGIDRSGLCFAAQGASPAFCTGCGAGRRGRLRPRAEVMAKRVRLTVGVAVAAAGAGIGRIAVFRTGRVCYDGAVVMSERRNHFGFRFAAVDAADLFFTVFRTCGVGDHPALVPGVFDHRDHFGFCLAAEDAAELFFARIRTGGVGDHKAVIPGVSDHRDHFGGRFSAADAKDFFLALCRTGWFYVYHALVPFVTQRGGFVGYVVVAAALAGVDRITACGTGRVSHSSVIVMPEGVDRSVFRRAAQGAGPAFHTAGKAGRRNRVRPLAERVFVRRKVRRDDGGADAVSQNRRIGVRPVGLQRYAAVDLLRAVRIVVLGGDVPAGERIAPVGNRDQTGHGFDVSVFSINHDAVRTGQRAVFACRKRHMIRKIQVILPAGRGRRRQNGRQRFRQHGALRVCQRHKIRDHDLLRVDLQRCAVRIMHKDDPGHVAGKLRIEAVKLE